MKKLLLLIPLIVVSLFANAQDRLTFDKVIQVEEIDKDNIYLGLKEWFALNFVSSKNVIELEDKEAGIIIGNTNVNYSKGSFTYACYKGWLNYTIKVQCKDGRFKVDVTNFRHQIQKGNSESCELGILTTADESGRKGMEKKYHNNVWKDLKEKSEEEANKIFDLLENVDFKNISDSSSEDW